ARRAYKDQIGEWLPMIEKVSDLFMRMRTDQAEVAATVHFAASELKAKMTRTVAESEVLEAVLDWKQKRRPRLEEKDVALTIRYLNILSWLGAEVSPALPISEEEFLPV